MDATMAEQAPQNGQAEAVPPQTDSTRQTGELFRYSDWVHVGVGAEQCDEREAGTCANPLHFHAWCRLPNQFQHQDIRERALAAKARRVRQLRDPETDAYMILESELAEVTDRNELVDELAAKDWWKRQLDAMSEVEQREEYAHIEKDRERFNELQALRPDDRPADEYDELERHFKGYAEAVDRTRAALEQPMRDALEGLDADELREQVRENRIAAEGSATFMDVYAKWQWLAGTHTSADPVTRKRRFTSMEQLEEAAPEVIEALRSTYSDLETALQRGAGGN